MFGPIVMIIGSIYLTLIAWNNRTPTVLIPQGEIKGKFWTSRNGRQFIGFTGIPYAKPPVGNLRFQPSVPADPFEDILDATNDHAVCPQVDTHHPNYNIIGNEDCLFLNVYTARLPKLCKSPLAVMFYIHGGALTFGSASPNWIGPDILLDKDIVLVIANYRLGALGFLSTADEWAPENNGLKDQGLALKWVKDNIIHFGGDPDKITVFGNSAGAVCTHYHMISSQSKNLINRAIIQSGSVFAPYALASKVEAIESAKNLGKYVNCSVVASDELVGCLKNVSACDIIRQSSQFLNFYDFTTIPFKIVIEGETTSAFLTEDPLKAIKSGHIADIPLMTGTVTEEGAYKAADYLQLHNNKFEDVVTTSFGIITDNENSSKKIKEFYFGDRNIDTTTKNKLTELYTDGLFLWAIDATIRLHRSYTTKSVYHYVFGYRGSISYGTSFNDPRSDYGVCHTDELLYLFSMKKIFPYYKPSNNDKKMSELITTLWTNFAKTGNPTPDANSTIRVIWEPVKSDHLEYYYFKNPDDITMEDNLYPSRMKLWRSLPTKTGVVLKQKNNDTKI